MSAKIGDVTVTPIVEIDWPVKPHWILPDATPENTKPYLDWLAPHYVTDDGLLRLVVQALLVESRGQKIIVDTCVGNDKDRDNPAWNQRDGPFLSLIEDAGFPREEIDLVVCTHLHVDHVGWNTMKRNDEWVPTFPNARYLWAGEEFDYWSKTRDEIGSQVFGDSVAPIFEAGLARSVASDHQITPELRFLSTPGHTPGHCAVAISSRGEEAIITGDLMHHPSQCAHPEWGCTFDLDPKRAQATRRDFLERTADRDIAVIGTHWGGDTAVAVRREGNRCRVGKRS